MGQSILKVMLILSLLLAIAAVYGHWPHTPLPPGMKADRVVVQKSQQRMILIHGGNILREYSVALGRHDGRKEQAGDGKTPEGRYRVDARTSDNSRYHLSLHISYPNAHDLMQAEEKGVDPGGGISIHGLREDLWFFGRWHHLVNWTRGCIALSNEEMEEAWRVIADNALVEIYP